MYASTPEIKIKTKGNIPLTRELEAFVHEKIGKLAKLIPEGDTTALFEVDLEERSHKSGPNYRAEVNYSSNGKVLRAEATEEVLHAAVDRVVEELWGRLRHLKTKHSDMARKTGAQVKGFLKRFGL